MAPLGPSKAIGSILRQLWAIAILSDSNDPGKFIWAHAHLLSLFVMGPLNVYDLHLQWAHVGFSMIIGIFASGVYRVLRHIFATWARLGLGKRCASVSLNTLPYLRY